MSSPESSDSISTVSLAQQTSAADKLSNAECEYSCLLGLAEAYKHRYKRAREDLRHGQAFMRLLAKEDRVECLDPRIAAYSTSMSLCRDAWLRHVMEAKAVKKQVLAKLVPAEQEEC